MAKKFDQTQINAMLETLATEMYAADGAYSRFAGRMQYMVSSLVAELPAHRQQEVIRVLGLTITTAS
jgi:hypothetical protein